MSNNTRHAIGQLLSFISLGATLWSLISIYTQPKSTKNENMEMYTYSHRSSPIDTVGKLLDFQSNIVRRSPKHLIVSVNTVVGELKLNKKRIKYGIPLDSIFDITGNPTRYKKIVFSNLAIYTYYYFDSFGVYFIADPQKKLKVMSIQFKKGLSGVTLHSVYDTSLTIDKKIISKKSLKKEIIQDLDIKEYPKIKDTYVKETEKLKLQFIFTSYSDELKAMSIGKRDILTNE